MIPEKYQLAEFKFINFRQIILSHCHLINFSENTNCYVNCGHLKLERTENRRFLILLWKGFKIPVFSTENNLSELCRVATVPNSVKFRKKTLSLYLFKRLFVGLQSARHILCFTLVGPTSIGTNSERFQRRTSPCHRTCAITKINFQRISKYL